MVYLEGLTWVGRASAKRLRSVTFLCFFGVARVFSQGTVAVDVAPAQLYNQSCGDITVTATMWAWTANPYSTWTTNVVLPAHGVLRVPVWPHHTDTVGLDQNGDSYYWLWRLIVVSGGQTYSYHVGQFACPIGDLCTNAVVRTNWVMQVSGVWAREKGSLENSTNKLVRILRVRKEQTTTNAEYYYIN